MADPKAEEGICIRQARPESHRLSTEAGRPGREVAWLYGLLSDPGIK